MEVKGREESGEQETIAERSEQGNIEGRECGG